MIRRFFLPLLLIPSLSACSGVTAREVIDVTRAASCEVCRLSGGDPREAAAAQSEALRKLTEAIAALAIQRGADRAQVDAELAAFRASSEADRARFERLFAAALGAPK